MNRFETAAAKIEKEYGVGVEYCPQSLAHPYSVEGHGCASLAEAKAKARQISRAAQHGGFVTKKKYA